MFGPVVDDDVHDHATAAAGAGARAVDFVGLDQSPLSARTPVPVELIERVLRMLAWVLLPLRIVHPDAVSGFVILLLQGIEEVADNAFLRPMAKPPAQGGPDHQNRDGRNDSHPALSRFCRVVLL